MMGETSRREEGLPKEVIPEAEEDPKNEVKEVAPFDKREAFKKVEDAVEKLFDMYGTNISPEIQALGTEAVDTAQAISRQKSVTTREQFIEAVDFMSAPDNVKAFIKENIG